ncbi:MAG: hypothetical protein Q7T55_11400, partial [Solirubrobacteraceae bacterium]|nr:hypothetical protein [Solirubrobacteraceae bacterium]
DQNKALAGNVTPGDTPGFPVTLSVPGSYKLTGNLTVPIGTTGITAAVPGITIDLNGFNIVGANTCIRDNVTYVVNCSDVFNGSRGVATHGGSVVRNGRISGFSIGLQYGPGDLVENMLVEQSHEGVIAQGGSQFATRAILRNVRAQFNKSYGFSLSDTLIESSSAGANGNSGFFARRTVILDSVSTGNGGPGVEGSISVSIGRSVVQENKGGNIFQASSLGGNLNGNVVY